MSTLQRQTTLDQYHHSIKSSNNPSYNKQLNINHQSESTTITNNNNGWLDDSTIHLKYNVNASYKPYKIDNSSAGCKLHDQCQLHYLQDLISFNNITIIDLTKYSIDSYCTAPVIQSTGNIDKPDTTRNNII